MHSAAQSEAMALNEAEIAHFAKNVQFWVAHITRTHGSMCVLLSLKHWLQDGTLDCTCSHMTLHDSMMDVRDEDVRRALAQVRARLPSKQAHLNAEQCQQGRWCCESPSTGTLYSYIVLLADTWLHSLAQPVDTAVSTGRHAGRTATGQVAGPCQVCSPRTRSLQTAHAGSSWCTKSLQL